MEKLAVVIPVYNEEEAIGAVIDKWVLELDRLGADYTINLYDDGSKDHSYQVILQKEKEYSGKVRAFTKTNSGHGPTILLGYREAARNGYDWIFQIDSDDEMGPEGFAELWERRKEYDFLVGIRDGRKQALPRKIISAVSRLSVRLFYGKSIWDVNTPYRLMRASAFQNVYDSIPDNTFAPNVIISGMAAKLKMRCFETRVPQHDRQTGEVSIKKWKLLKAAIRSFLQTVFFAMDRKPGMTASVLLSGWVAALIVVQFHSFREWISGAVKSHIDSSVYLTIAGEMLHGSLPYRDFFDHKGLYIYFIDALGLLTNLAFVEWLCLALAALILYKTLLLAVRPRLALFLTIVWPVFLVRYSLFFFGNMTECFLLPAIAFAVYYMAAFIRRNGAADHLLTFLLGMSFGWVVMIKLNYISTFVSAGLFLLLTLCLKKQYKDLLFTVLSGLAGVLVSLLPGILYLWKHDLFSDFADSYILFNMRYADSFQIGTITRMFRCWPNRCMPNGLARMILLIPWLSAPVLFVRKEKEDRLLVAFILVTLSLDAVTIWMRTRFFEHYLIPLTVIALLSYAMILKYALVLWEKITKGDQFARSAVAGFFCVSSIVLIVSAPLILRKGIVRTKYACSTDGDRKDEALVRLLENNGNRLVVLGNKCFYYRLYDAVPDNRFLYQIPIANVSSEIWDSFFNDIHGKKTPLILIPLHDTVFDWSDYSKCVPEKYRKYLSEHYSQTECLHGILFVRDSE